MALAFLTVANCVVAAASEGVPPSDSELGQCVANLLECLSVLMAANMSGAANEEELAFSILGSWMKQLYVKQEAPRLAEDFPLRSATLAHLQDLAVISIKRPSVAIAVGQMLFLYFWWGARPPPSSGADPSFRGPDLAVVSMAADLHARSIRFSGCDTPLMQDDEFTLRKCPWRWRFLLLLLVESGRKFILVDHDLANGARQFSLANKHLQTMRTLTFFTNHGSLHEGPYRTNHNDDFLPHARHQPIWPREMWPAFASYLEMHADIFLTELARIMDADKDFNEVFTIVQGQQTEFTPLPEEWGLLDLVRNGHSTAACPYAPMSCQLLQNRPEVNDRCFSPERMPNAGVAFARLLPGTEIKPHFATEPRIAIHLGLVTPPGASMMVANETVTWTARQAIVFDDTYFHSVRHDGAEPRYVLLAWTCHPCDLLWRAGLDAEWHAENPYPAWCESG